MNLDDTSMRLQWRFDDSIFYDMCKWALRVSASIVKWCLQSVDAANKMGLKEKNPKMLRHRKSQ